MYNIGSVAESHASVCRGGLVLVRLLHGRCGGTVTLLVAAVCAGSSTGALRVFDLAGHPIDPFSTRAAKADVFLFVRVDCPISNRYAPEVKRLAAKFGAQGVAFKLVYVDPAEPSEEIRQHIHDYGYNMSALRDNAHTLVKLTGATVTPEAAVFVPGASEPRLVYLGRIDDRYVDFGKTRPAPTTHDLEDVLLAIVEGKAVSYQTTRAVGCFIQDLK